MVIAAAGWRVIQDPPGEPQFNMDRDEALSREAVAQSRPILRLYRWDRPAVSLGRRQNPDDLPADLLRRNLPMVHRPTGGGAVLHRLDELTYALAVPRAHLPAEIRPSEFPGHLHAHLRKALLSSGSAVPEKLRFARADSPAPHSLCFQSPVRGDLLWGDAKIAGNALRVWREGLLLQGSIQGLPASFDQIAAALCDGVRGCFHLNKFRNFASRPSLLIR